MPVAIRNCLGLDIGSQTIRIAAIEMGRAGPRVLQLIEEPLRIEPGVAEAQRLQLVAQQIQQMLKTHKLRAKNAVFSIPGQSVFVRRMKLPRTTGERMHRIIRFEARQQIPFPLEKTIMEYQVFEEDDSPEVNVLLVAIKREFIMNFMRMVRRTGLRPIGISVSTLALYNFHELNGSTRDLMAKPSEKEPAKPKKETVEEAELDLGEEDALEARGFEEIQAYVNLGASLMDIAIPKPGSARMIGFPRSVPLAGNEMDRAVRDRLGLESFEDARRVKEEEAVILSTEFELEGDSEAVNMEASEAVTAMAERMINELRRSLDFYISQPDGVAVDSIVLSGGMARMKYLANYIEEKMGVPVELATAKNSRIRMPETTPEAFSPFAVALGLAYQGLRLAQNTINFLPEDIKNVRGLQERRNEVVGMAAMLLVAIVLNFNVGSAYTTRYRSDTNELRRDMTEKQRLHQDVQKAQKQHGSLADAYEKLSKAVGWREYWFEFLKYFIERRPPEILVDEMHLRLDGNVVVRGRSPNQDSVTRMLTALEEFTWITWKIELGSMQEQYDPRFQSDMWDFEFTLKTLVRSGRVRTIGEQPVSTELLELQDELKRRGREARQQKKRSGRGRERP